MFIKKEDLRAPNVLAAATLGLSFIVAIFIMVLTFYSLKTFDNTLSVTGSAKKHATSDSAKWVFSISRRVPEYGMQNGYAAMARDLAAAKTFLAGKKVSDSEITVSPVLTEEIYKYSQGGESGPREYALREMITVQSNDIAKIGGIAKSVEELSGKGVFISNQPPEYFYSKLSELRVSLLGAAIKDARSRADEIAKESGQRVGRLKTAASGVVQVLAPNSIEVSDYGQYDTGSVEKDIMVTVRASFAIR